MKMFQVSGTQCWGCKRISIHLRVFPAHYRTQTQHGCLIYEWRGKYSAVVLRSHQAVHLVAWLCIVQQIVTVELQHKSSLFVLPWCYHTHHVLNTFISHTTYIFMFNSVLRYILILIINTFNVLKHSGLPDSHTAWVPLPAFLEKYINLQAFIHLKKRG